MVVPDARSDRLRSRAEDLEILPVVPGHRVLRLAVGQPRHVQTVDRHRVTLTAQRRHGRAHPGEGRRGIRQACDTHPLQRRVNLRAHELDQAVMHTPLRGRAPLWWSVFGGGQLVLAVAAVLGLLWLLVVGVAGWLQLPDVPTLDVGPFATPFLLVVGGLLGGLLLAALSRWLAVIGARRRARMVEQRLRRSIGGVADATVIEPVQSVLAEHARTRAGLARSLG